VSQTRVIVLEAAPLLLLAALYLVVAAALAPQLWRGRRFSWLGLGVWTLFVFIGALAATIGGAIVDDESFLGGISPWPVFALTLVAYIPAAIILWRWRERALLVTAGRRVYEAEHQATARRREAESISRLSTALSRTLSGQDAADHLFDEIQAALGIERLLLALVDEPARRAYGFAARGVDEEWWRSVSIDLDRDPGGIVAVARDGTPFSIYDVPSAPNVNRALAEAVGAKSVAFVPLVLEGQVTGVLIAAQVSAHRHIAQVELDFIQGLASETALALGRAHSEEALASALARERLIAEISRKVRSELDLDAVLAVAVEEVGRAGGVTRVFVRLGEPGEESPIVAEWDSPGFGPIGAAAPRLPVTNLAIREQRTVAIGDMMAAPELDDPSLGGRATLVDLGVRAVLAVPVQVFDRTIGVFSLQRAEPTTWTEGDVSLAEAVARELGLAVHTAQLLRENKRRLEQQQALVNSAQTLTSDLRFDAVIRRLVDEIVTVLRADAADVWIFDEERQLLRCHAVVGVPERNVGRLIPPEGTIARVIARGRPELKRQFATTEKPAPSEDYAVFAEVMDAPITWLGEVRGVLGVCSREHGSFDEADLEVLDTFARLASLALHNAESFEERERQTQVQRGFYGIARVLGSTLSLSETLNALARAACEALGGSASIVLEPRGDRLYVAGSHDVPAPLERAIRGGLPHERSPIAAAAREERVITASGLAEDERFDSELRRLLVGIGYGSLLCAPVAGVRGEKNAAIVLYGEERDFSDDDIALARHLSGAARGAIERAELFEGERRARRVSQRLADFGSLLATKLDPPAAYAEVVREAPALVGADAAVLRVLEDDNLAVRAASGAGAAPLVGTRTGSAAGPAGVVAQSRTPLTVEDVAAAPRLRREDPLLGTTMASCAAMPMIAHGGRLYGVLTVYSTAPRTWRDDELQALGALAATASSALSSSELYRRVAEEKERSDAILGNIADGIVAVDREGTIVLWNAMAEQITGVPASEALGRRVAEVLQRDLADEGAEVPGERAVSIIRGGTEVWLSLTEAVMRDPAGAVAGRIFAFRDVSSERIVEQIKSDFVATVSHELRTPLTSIYGFAETLMRSDVDFSTEERTTFLNYMATESERLIGIVDDLLNVARLETGTLGLSLARTEVGEVVSEVVARVAEHDGAHEFAVDVDDGGAAVHADREKLSQIVMNLVDNAVKFSPEGGRVTVTARRHADSVEVRVSDEGIGIARGDQLRIFTKFYRVETITKSGVPGTGLGLFLARGLLAAMGGRIWVESKEGEGSSFVFELPLAQGEAVVEEPEPVAT
jgi:two-component system phosphate regulon sensor histidine kinase PhoR